MWIDRLRDRDIVDGQQRQHPLANGLVTQEQDVLGDKVDIVLPGVTPGTNFERFRAKAAAYLKQHEDHVALQRLQRNKQLTPDDLTALEGMLLAAGGGTSDTAQANEQTGGLGLFIRSLVGLDRGAAAAAFEHYLDGTRFPVEQVRFVNLIVDELTANGVMEPKRLFESPYTDHAPTGPDFIFPNADDVTVIVEILDSVRQSAVPVEVARSRSCSLFTTHADGGGSELTKWAIDTAFLAENDPTDDGANNACKPWTPACR